MLLVIVIDEEIYATFYEKKLEKKNQRKFRV